MTIRSLILGACLVISGIGLAQTTTYQVRPGDSVSSIAERFGVRQVDVFRANGITSRTTLRVGQRLAIPTRVPAQSRGSRVSGSSGYLVRNGDNDRLIARRMGITVSQLHAANPNVNWRRLQIGDRISLPGQARRSRPTVASAPRAGGQHIVQRGDNDWVIARRTGTTAKIIRQLNPSVNWRNLRPGDTIRIPSVRSGAVASARPRTTAPTSGHVRNRLSSRYAVVVRDAVKVRRSPSTNGSVITQVGQGVRVTVLGRTGDWYRLRFPRGTEGWVRSDLLRNASAPPVVAARSKTANQRTKIAARSSATGSSVVDAAMDMLGTRYRFGAMSRSSVDCSGFTSLVFRAHGIRLPRTSAEQARAGRPTAGGLQKGDLVFFRTGRGRRINHVGIYIGNGRFIHASSGGGRVQVNGMGERYYRSRFVTSRRVLPNARVAETAAEDVERQVTAPASSQAVVEASVVEPEIAPPSLGTDEVVR